MKLGACNTAKYIIAFVVIFLFCSCSEEAPRDPIEDAEERTSKTDQPAFTPPHDVASEPHEVRRLDVNRDGYDDAVTLTYPVDSLEAQLGFYRLQIFEYAPGLKKFFNKFDQEFYYGRQILLRDLNADTFPEICISVYSGGNSATLDNGLSVVSYNHGFYELELVLESGDPIIERMPGDSALAIVVHDEFWPLGLSHAESVDFVDSLIFLAPYRVSMMDSLAHWKIRRALEATLVEYRELYRAEALAAYTESAYMLYSAVARCAIYARKLGKPEWFDSLRSSDAAKWESLLPPEYMEALQIATTEAL